MNQEQKTAISMKVSIITILGNLALTVIKLIAGVFANSGAMISDAVHSASDIVSTVVVIWGVKLSSQAEDEEHPYGHERMESVAAVALAGLLAVTGASIGMSGVNSIINSLNQEISPPGTLALVAALISIIAKEVMYQYTRIAAKKIDSPSLMADAWHHRSDALSSIGALIGIGGAMLGFPIMDPIACVVISGVIIKVAYDIAKQAFNQMVDAACPPELEKQMQQVVIAQNGVIRLDSLTTRQFGSRVYVDVSIAANSALTIKEGHDIAFAVHEAIEGNFPMVKHCMVHVNPFDVS